MGKKSWGKNGVMYVLTDHGTGVQIEMEREELKEAMKYFLVELTVVEFKIQDGRTYSLVDRKFIDTPKLNLEVKRGEKED